MTSQAQHLALSLVETLGYGITTVVSNAKNACELSTWCDGEKQPSTEQLDRIRFTHDILSSITANKDFNAALGWLLSDCSLLSGSTPAQAIRDGNLTGVQASAACLMNSKQS